MARRVFLRYARLPRDSVVNVTAIVTLNKTDLTDRVGEAPSNDGLIEDFVACWTDTAPRQFVTVTFAWCRPRREPRQVVFVGRLEGRLHSLRAWLGVRPFACGPPSRR